MKWTGTKWKTQKTLRVSLWRYTGCPNSLDFHTLDQDVALSGGVLGKQRLSFRCWNTLAKKWCGHAGRYNSHFLE